MLCECFRIEPTDQNELWASNGDSGSIVFRQEDNNIKPAVGLFFGGGGTPPNNWGVACKISNVLAELDLGPLCIAGCTAFLDALYADASDGQEVAHSISPLVFTPNERRRGRSFHVGLTLDLRGRLRSSLQGRSLLSFIERHRSELMPLLARDGDVRRAIVVALRPIFAGAATTSDILERPLRSQDVKRLRRLLTLGESKGSPALAESIKTLAKLLEGDQTRSLGQIFRVEG